jgi:tetratricopeptide (TPR) repeat protein
VNWSALPALFLAGLAVAGPDDADRTRGREQDVARTLWYEAKGILDSLYQARPNAGFRYADEVAAGLAAAGDHQAAEALFGHNKGTGRYHDVSLRTLAVGYARGGDLARTRATIARIQDSEPNYAKQKPLAWLNAGRAFAKAGREEAAAEAFAAAMRGTPPGGGFPSIDGQFLAEVAEGQYRAGLDAESATTFRLAIARAAQDPHLQSSSLGQIAEMQARLGLLSQAEATIEQIADPKDRQWGWSRLVKAEVDTGRLDEAARLVQRIDGAPVAEAYLVLAAARFKAGQRPEARRALEQAEAAPPQVTAVFPRIQLDTRFAEARAMLGDRAAAAAWLKEATALAMDAPAGPGGRAASPIERQIEQVPGAMFRKSGLVAIATTQAKLGFMDDARRSFDRAKEASRDLQTGLWQNAAMTMLARAQAEAGLPDDAMRTLESLPQADLKWLDYVPVAVARAKARDFTGARHIIERYLNDASGTRSYIAQGLFQAGDLDNALRISLQSSSWTEELTHDAARKITASGRKLPLRQPLDKLPPELRVTLLAGMAEGLLDRAEGAAGKPATGPATPAPSPGGPADRPRP